MNIHSLFPTPVAFFKFEDTLTEEQKTFLLEQEQVKNIGNTSSKNRLLLDDPLLANVREFVDNSLRAYMVNIYSPANDVRLRVTQSWLNWSKPGQHHHKHAHPNSFLSGCFYVQASESDKIYFHRDGYQQIKLKPEAFNIFNSESWWLSVLTGDLVIFPSYLTHHVDPVTAEQTRISLAFNTFPVGYVGNDDELTGLRV